MSKTTCPTCGTICRVVGDTTLHYEPVASPLEVSWETLAATEGERDEAREQVAALREENRRLLVLVAWMWDRMPDRVGSMDYKKVLHALDVPDGGVVAHIHEIAQRGRELVEGKGNE